MVPALFGGHVSWSRIGPIGSHILADDLHDVSITNLIISKFSSVRDTTHSAAAFTATVDGQLVANAGGWRAGALSFNRSDQLALVPFPSH